MFRGSITGLPVSCGFMAPSLLWIKENQPSLWKRIHKVLLPKDYLRMKLTGVAASDVTDVGGTLLLDTAKRIWSREIIDELLSENITNEDIMLDESKVIEIISKKVA